MKTYIVLLSIFLAASGALAQGGLVGADVSFMDFATVDPAAVCGRLATTDRAALMNLKRFAQFEALHNARGGAETAKKILACIDGSGLLRPASTWGAAASSIRVRAPKRPPSAPGK